DEPAFGVGVEHLDCLARHRAHYVARALGVAGRHVLDQADNADRVDLGAPGAEETHQSDHHAGPGHVPFHIAHPGGGLDRVAAGVESDPLADKAEGWAAHGPALMLDDDDARRPDTALADPEQRAHAEFGHPVFVEDLDRET